VRFEVLTEGLLKIQGFWAVAQKPFKIVIKIYAVLSKFCGADPYYELATVMGLPVERCTANQPLRFEASSIISE
jgi:hypothetical protein